MIIFVCTCVWFPTKYLEVTKKKWIYYNCFFLFAIPKSKTFEILTAFPWRLIFKLLYDDVYHILFSLWIKYEKIWIDMVFKKKPKHWNMFFESCFKTNKEIIF
jgi:hypothetical protein